MCVWEPARLVEDSRKVWFSLDSFSFVLVQVDERMVLEWLVGHTERISSCHGGVGSLWVWAFGVECCWMLGSRLWGGRLCVKS